MEAMTTPERAGVELTHLDEPLFDGAGATKRDLVDYLDAVAGLILPELRDRPLSVIRAAQLTIDSFAPIFHQEHWAPRRTWRQSSCWSG
jgi:DNA primase